MMTENKNGKGFSGFDALVSDVSKDLEDANEIGSSKTKPASGSASTATKNEQTNSPRPIKHAIGHFDWVSAETTSQQDSLKTDGRSNDKWVAGAIIKTAVVTISAWAIIWVVAGIIGSVLVNSRNNDAPPTPAPPVEAPAPAPTSKYVLDEAIFDAAPAAPAGRTLSQPPELDLSEIEAPSAGRAPNGKKWPTKSGYLQGYEPLFADGLSTVTIDNTQNNSDVYVKLFALNSQEPIPVRHCFIKAGSKFKLNTIRAGNYDIRYRDLRTGGISKADSFQLREISTLDGTQYSNVTMTLYKVSGGNMRTYPISENEF